MSTLSPKGQALVRAGRRAFQPTDADRVRLVGELRSRLGDAALPANAGTAASAAAAAGKTMWPLLSVVVVGVGILGGVLSVARHKGGAQEDLQKVNSAAVAAPTQPISADTPPSDEPPTISDPGPSPTTPPIAPTPWGHRRQDRLAAEVEILSRATRDLRSGHPAEALKALDEYRHKFPKGLLGEEQRAARAQALCALGRFDEANAKMAGLGPQSPLAIRAKQFCDARWAAR